MNTELHGHGDPMLVAATKAAPASTEPSEVPPELERISTHSVSGHGDPLFQEVHMHSAHKPLNTERLRQGDPLFEDVIDTWKDGDENKVLAQKQNLHELPHGEFKKHGDPLLDEFHKHEDDNDSTDKETKQTESRVMHFLGEVKTLLHGDLDGE
eukprot:CAMPEP_0198287740 /NCGR_PEP_ID=MMETSP1449-20131203/6453_1 /TAXON_ID=420275 /ORGANISM="Attheya septentrionalis, Strain CCMP2084" /LENGTH=153 /DNA_ID=CAMNT_0043985745 /DNA_START=98 /DNA_END=559 /DNA_ORIENTATION=-